MASVVVDDLFQIAQIIKDAFIRRPYQENRFKTDGAMTHGLVVELIL